MLQRRHYASITSSNLDFCQFPCFLFPFLHLMERCNHELAEKIGIVLKCVLCDSGDSVYTDMIAPPPYICMIYMICINTLPSVKIFEKINK